MPEISQEISKIAERILTNCGSNAGGRLCSVQLSFIHGTVYIRTVNLLAPVYFADPVKTSTLEDGISGQPKIIQNR